MPLFEEDYYLQCCCLICQKFRSLIRFWNGILISSLRIFFNFQDSHHIHIWYLSLFCTPPHFLACKLYARKVWNVATKNCLATKARKSILSVLAVLVGVLAILVGVFGVLCIGMVYLLHEIEHSELGLVYLVFSLKECEDLCLHSLHKLC